MPRATPELRVLASQLERDPLSGEVTRAVIRSCLCGRDPWSVRGSAELRSSLRDSMRVVLRAEILQRPQPAAARRYPRAANVPVRGTIVRLCRAKGYVDRRFRWDVVETVYAHVLAQSSTLRPTPGAARELPPCRHTAPRTAHVATCARRASLAAWAPSRSPGVTRAHQPRQDSGTLHVRFLGGDSRLPILRLRDAA